MNKVVLTGNVVRDPQINGTDNKVARFTVAVQRRYNKNAEKQESDFISCAAFGKTAEFVGNYIKKGSAVEIDGRIQTGSYTNREGQKVYTTDVVVENLAFGRGSKNKDSETPEAESVEEFPEDDLLPWNND